MIKKKLASRNISLDILRIVAIIMVFYNHRFTFIYSDSFDHISLKYILGAVLSIICKCGPPLFFMISGALLLKKEEKFSLILKHRVLRILIVMLLCSILVMIRDGNYDFLGILNNGLNWYLYQYLAFLLMLPFLRKIVLALKKKEMVLYLIITFLFYTITGALLLFDIQIELFNHTIFYTSSWGSCCWLFIFPITGYILTKVAEDKKEGTKLLKICGVMSAVSLLLFTIICSVDIKTNSAAHLENIREHAIYPVACFIFAFAYLKINAIKSEKANKTITFASKATFGMFLIETHTILSNIIFDKVYAVLQDYMGLYWISIIAIVAIFISYALIASLLRILPVMRKIL